MLTLFLLIACTTEIERTDLITTGIPGKIGATSADISGVVIDFSSAPTQHGHCWAKSPSVTLENSLGKTELGAKSERGEFISKITGLQEQTTYYVKAYAIIGNKTIYGAEADFTTLEAEEDPAKAIQVLGVINILSNTATAIGSITNNNADNIASYGHCWALGKEDPTIDDKKSNFTNISEIADYKTLMTNLSANSEYYVKAYYTLKSGETLYGNAMKFKTAK
ncbi:MAG: hypothetical protein OHK0038_14300 [Flammeovirgaceae bacterium]